MSPAHPNVSPPNFLIFLCDNLGYGDTEPYGSQLHRTPNLNRLAQEGRKFTHFYTSANEELYDLRQDPDQIRNIAGRPENAAVTRDLAARIDRWMKETGDPRLDPAYERFNTYPYFGGGLAPVEHLMEAIVETR